MAIKRKPAPIIAVKPKVSPKIVIASVVAVSGSTKARTLAAVASVLRIPRK